MTYSIENRGNTPVYMYLYECIRKDILAGRIAPGERLPSKRPFAAHLGVAIITVENAYAQLMTEGYIQSREKRGYYVSEDMEVMQVSEIHKGTTYVPEEYVKEVNLSSTDMSEPYIGEDNGLRVNEHKKSEKEESQLIDFSGNSVKSDSFPFDSWARLMRRSMLDHETDFQYAPDGQGVYELRKAIADYLYKSKGMNVSAERILVGPGTEYLHHILIQLLGRNCFVAVEDPGYKKVGRIYETNGVRVLHIPVDEHGMVVDRLKGSNVKLVHISPSHHFPTGSVMPIHRRGRLLSWAKGQDAYIIEDDYDSEFRFEGRPLSTLYSMDSSHVIYMNTFTKVLAPSIRIAYMVLPDILYDKYREKLYFYSGTVSGFEQYTLASFINEGYYERHIRRVRNRYKKYRAQMLTAISESGLLEYISVDEDRAGLQLVFEIKGTNNDSYASLVDRLISRQVKIIPLTDYCYHNTGEYNKKFLLYYSEMENELMMKAFEIIIEELVKIQRIHK